MYNKGDLVRIHADYLSQREYGLGLCQVIKHVNCFVIVQNQKGEVFAVTEDYVTPV